MNEPLRRQVFVPRVHTFETPHSYLARICGRNMIDAGHMLQVVVSRKRQTKRPHELGVVIRELGGPDESSFVMQWVRAGNDLEASDTGQAPHDFGSVFRRTLYTRSACEYCTRGETVTTYEHEKFMMCLKHGRWVQPQSAGRIQRQVPPGWRRTERQFRRLQRHPLLPATLHHQIWDLIRDNALMLGNAGWGDRIRSAQENGIAGLDDRISLYPETVRVLATCTDLDIWEHLIMHSPSTWERGGGKLRALLHQRLAWAGDASDIWVLAEGLAVLLARMATGSVPDLAYRLIMADPRRATAHTHDMSDFWPGRLSPLRTRARTMAVATPPASSYCSDFDVYLEGAADH